MPLCRTEAYVLTSPCVPSIFVGTLKLDLVHQGEGPWNLNLVFEEAISSEIVRELRLHSSLQAQVLLVAFGPEMWRVEATIQGTQLLTCARTLEPFERPFEIQLTAEVERVSGIRSQEVNDDDENLFKIRIPVTQGVVDLSECVRQLVFLQEPINPIKDPESDFAWQDSDREAEDANHQVDPRWLKLKEWKDRNTEK